MKRWLPVLCLAMVATTILSASTWEGSAMMSAYGEFPESGYYGACNSFPRNTAVEVVNLENGKSVTVIITKGSDNPGIFLLLSPEAAKGLSMNPGAVSRVRVSAPRNIAEPLMPSAAATTTADPDFNPSLLASRGSETQTSEWSPEESAESVPVEESPAETPEEAVPEPEIAAEPETKAVALAPESAPEEESEKTVEPEPQEPPVVQPEAIERSNVMPTPSRPVTAYMEVPESPEPEAAEDENALVYGIDTPETVALAPEAELADPTLIPDELPEAASLRQSWPEDTAPSVKLADCEIHMEEAEKPEAIGLSEAAPATEEEVPEAALGEPQIAAVEDTSASPTEPVGEDMETIVSIEPAEPKPPTSAPETAPTSEPEKIAEERPASFSTTSFTKREAGKFYIQIGAFKNTDSLETAARKLYGNFPVTIETTGAGTSSLYRLFVGPLVRDETGIMLVKVRSIGFKDAFVKK